VTTGIEGTGAELVARALKELGVDRVFSLCGDHINSLFRALTVHDIDIVGVRHETAAVQMADAWSRATGKPGVAVVTGGPGHTSAVTGFAIAHGAGTPVVVISGQSPLGKRERGGHQILYQADIVRSVTKSAREIASVEQIPEFVYRAFVTATEGTPGPVSLSIPSDVMNAKVPAGSDASHYRVAALDRHVGRVSGNVVGGERAEALLASARRPVLIAGSGAWWDVSPGEMATAVRTLGMPTFTVELARGLIPDDGEICFGYADPRFNRTIMAAKEADLVVLLGVPLDFHLFFGSTRLFAPDVRFVQLERDPARLGIMRAADAALLGPLGPSLRYLVEADGKTADRGARADWLERVRSLHRDNLGEWERLMAEAQADPTTIHPLHVCRSLDRHYTDRTAIMIDAGDFVHWPRIYFGARAPGRWMDGSTMGTLGPALPMGIAAQMAFPGDPVWVFQGDGGFTYSAWDLTTAVERKLPVKVIVGHDAAWGIELRLQLADYNQAVACDLPDTRMDRFAELVGARGIYVSDPAELDTAVDELMAADGPCVLNVRIRQLASRPLVDVKLGQ
jgi:acetolactate synthase-1/2/3 large subunit